MALTPQRKRILLFILLGAIVITLGYLWLHAGEEATDDAAIEAHVVPIAARVPGYVTQLSVIDNQQVKAGDVLLQIDPRDYQIRLDHALASLNEAKAKLEGSSLTLETTRVSAPSGMTSAQAQVDAAEADWKNASLNLKRLRSLSALARSQQQLDQAVATEKAAKSAWEDAKARLRSAATAPKTVAAAESSVHELEASVKQAEADVAEAQKNLADTKLIAPIDGRVTKRGVEQGAYIQPGQQLLSLVGNDLWVVANYKETQLKKMKPGQPVDITVDAFPATTYHGKIDSVQGGTGARFSAFPPENATGNFVKIVQRVPVKILFDQRPDPALPIGPGMSVSPVVHVK